MKNRSLISVLCLLFAHVSLLQAQRPEAESAPKRVGFIDPAAFGVGRPGFVADATFMGMQDFSDRPGGLDFFELRTIAPVGAKKMGDFLLAGSIGYTLTELGFNGFEGLGDETLHTLEAQITLLWRPEQSRWSALGFVTPGIGTDFQGVSGDDFEIAGLGLVNYRFTDTFSLAAGVFGQYAAEDGMIGPALGFIWQPKSFIVQLTPPFAVIGWDATERLTLSLSAYPSGGAWAVDTANVNRIDLSGWQTAASLMYKLTDHVTLSLRGGFNIGGELELQDARNRVIASEDLEPAPFAAINLRYNF